MPALELPVWVEVIRSSTSLSPSAPTVNVTFLKPATQMKESEHSRPAVSHQVILINTPKPLIY